MTIANAALPAAPSAAPAPAAPTPSPSPAPSAPVSAPKPSPAPAARAPRASKPSSSLPHVVVRPTVSAVDALGFDIRPSESIRKADVELASRIGTVGPKDDGFPSVPNPASRMPEPATPAAPAPAPAEPEAPAPAAPAAAEPPPEWKTQMEAMQAELAALKQKKEEPAPAPAAPQVEKPETAEEKAARETEVKRRTKDFLTKSISETDFSAMPVASQEEMDTILAGGPEALKAFEATSQRIAAHAELKARKSILTEINPLAETFRTALAEVYNHYQGLKDYEVDQTFATNNPEFGARMDVVRGVREELKQRHPDFWFKATPDQQAAELARQANHRLTLWARNLGFNDWRQLPAASASPVTPPAAPIVPAAPPVAPVVPATPARPAAPPAPPAPRPHAPHGGGAPAARNAAHSIAMSLRD